MELKIEWTEIREVSIFGGRFYFVANTSKAGKIKDFCVAYKTLERWRIDGVNFVPFEITHVCLINEVIHKISKPAHAIGDRVMILLGVEEYKQGSVGEIVGKYDKSRTWCIRMEDNFVILLEDKWFKRHYPGGE